MTHVLFATHKPLVSPQIGLPLFAAKRNRLPAEVKAKLESKAYMQGEYVEKKHSAEDIAESLQVNPGTVYKYLRRLKIKVRSVVEGIWLAHQGQFDKLTKAFLQQEYVEKERSAKDIADELGVDQRTVRDRLKLFDLPVRTAIEGVRLKRSKAHAASTTPSDVKSQTTPPPDKPAVQNPDSPETTAEAPSSPVPIEETPRLSRGKKFTKAYLEAEYVQKQRSIRAIAKEHNVTPPTVRHYLVKFRIPIRNATQATRIQVGGNFERLTKAYLKREFVKQGRSVDVIALDCGVSPATIRNRLNEFGISRNPSSP